MYRICTALNYFKCREHGQYKIAKFYMNHSKVILKAQRLEYNISIDGLHYSGSAGSDDYEIVLPRVVTGQNLTWAMVGPRYTVDKPVILEILGPR